MVARMVEVEAVEEMEAARPVAPEVEESAARREVGEPGALACSRHSLLGSDFGIVPFGIAKCRQGRADSCGLSPTIRTSPDG
jgi:hypothetical protein